MDEDGSVPKDEQSGLAKPKNLLAGYLQEQQGPLRRWQRRWFVLKDDLVLYSYKAPEVG